MSMTVNKKAKITAIIFIGVVILVLAGIIIPVCVLPYDSGILSSANLMGNLNFGGGMGETTDYIFETVDNKIVRYEKGSKNDPLVIYESAIDKPEYLNPYDGWVWFVDGGKIFRIAYYGQVIQEFTTPNGASRMSVNGSWIYFMDAVDNKVYKIRDNGDSLKPVTKVPVKSYASDNRKIVFIDMENNLCVANTDGSDSKILDTDVSIFTYTLDELYYLKDGVILHIPSLAAGYDAGLIYTPEKAETFTYATDTANGRGRLFFLRENTLYCKQLATENNNTEQLVTLAEGLEDIQVMYYISGRIYYGSKGNLEMLDVSQHIAEITPTDK